MQRIRRLACYFATSVCWRRSVVAIVVLFGVVGPGGAAPVHAQDQDEAPRRFIETWEQADRLLGQPDRLITLWREFAEHHPEHALGHVARMNQALWTLRQAVDERERTGGEDPGDGFASVHALLDLPQPASDGPLASPLYRHVHHAALGLRARVQMLELAERLRAYYARHVEYPPTLEALVDANLASAEQTTDPFGARYEYSARARAIMPNIARQTFTLRCKSIDAAYEALPHLLERLGEPVEDLQISSVVPERGQAYVRDRQRDGTWGVTRRWEIGQQPRDRRLWAVYEEYLLMAQDQVPQVVRMKEAQE